MLPFITLHSFTLTTRPSYGVIWELAGCIRDVIPGYWPTNERRERSSIQVADQKFPEESKGGEVTTSLEMSTNTGGSLNI